MHFIVCWKIDATGTEEKELAGLMQDCLDEYVWVRPLDNFYIVEVSSPSDWNNIFKALSEVAGKYPEDKVNFIMGPLIQKASYDGLLPHDAWEPINEITSDPG